LILCMALQGKHQNEQNDAQIFHGIKIKSYYVRISKITIVY
jgi:hypothetical protein